MPATIGKSSVVRLLASMLNSGMPAAAGLPASCPWTAVKPNLALSRIPLSPR